LWSADSRIYALDESDTEVLIVLAAHRPYCERLTCHFRSPLPRATAAPSQRHRFFLPPRQLHPAANHHPAHSIGTRAVHRSKFGARTIHLPTLLTIPANRACRSALVARRREIRSRDSARD